MKSKGQQKAEMAAMLSRIEAWVRVGNWLGASWATYPELGIDPERVYEVQEAIPEWVWDESSYNFRCATADSE